MAYTKTTWAAGDTVTSQKLNKIENQLETLSNGGGAGCFVVNITKDTTNKQIVYVTDKTYNEIATAIQNGSLPIGIIRYTNNGSNAWIHAIFIDVGFDADDLVYKVHFVLDGARESFYTTDPDSVLTTSVSSGPMPVN